MVDNGEHWEREDSRGTKIQILSTNPDNLERGRTFVWTKMGWFERIEGQSGNVAFSHVARSEEELRNYISSDNPSVDLVSSGSKYSEMVAEEFMQQSRSYIGSREDSDEEFTKADKDDDKQKYHQHN
jgi:hypothetical protein